MPNPTANANTIISFLTSGVSAGVPESSYTFTYGSPELHRVITQPLVALSSGLLTTYPVIGGTFTAYQSIAGGVATSFEGVVGSVAESQISSPVASWLGAVERRLNASIGITGGRDIEVGAALTKEVVQAANVFFAATSSVLPGEPYLYGLPSGELVAEFDANYGRMTLVISDDSALALAVIDGQTIHKSIAVQAATPTQMQADLSVILSQLSKDQHGGAMDTGGR